MAGIRCPHVGCGSLLSDVVATRPRGLTIMRRRTCINGHTFVTHESVVQEVATEYRPLSAQIRQMLREGKSELEVVATLNVGSHYVRKLARDMGITK